MAMALRQTARWLDLRKRFILAFSFLEKSKYYEESEILYPQWQSVSHYLQNSFFFYFAPSLCVLASWDCEMKVIYLDLPIIKIFSLNDNASFTCLIVILDFQLKKGTGTLL